MKRIILLAALLLMNVKLKAFATDTTTVEKRYSKNELSEDVRYLTGTLNKVHPNMYHSISEKQYQKVVNSVIKNLRDSMTAKESFPVMAPLVGAINEGHSTLNYSDNVIDGMKAGGNVLFPLVLREFDGVNLIVQADVSKEDKLRRGDQISKINEIAAPQLIDYLSQHMGGLRSFRASEVYTDIITYLNLYNIKGPYHITYKRNGIQDSAVINSISWADFKRRRMAQAKTNPTNEHKYADYSFSYLDNNKAYLNLNTLTIKPGVFNTFIDSCFTLLKNKPAKTLIIDLRRNGGGNSVLAETLLNYITDQPFRMTAGVNWKVSQEYKDYLKEKLKGDAAKRVGHYLDAENGSIIKSNEVEVKKPAENALRYNGKVVVLIGSHTFSSANMLANTIQDYKLATLVGEPSGEPANDYGETIRLKLPHTGLSFTTSTKQFIRANGNKKDLQPVLPQYKVADNPSTETDEVLEYAKGL